MTSHLSPPRRPGPTPAVVTGGSQRPSPWGTQRRLRALMNRSWAPRAIGRASAIPAAQITQALARLDNITPEFAERVAAVYDRLWDQQPPQVTREDGDLAAAARAHAHRRGWPPPMAYDDDLIDLPEGDAEPGWQPTSKASHRSADLAEDAAWVREHGGYRHASLAVVAMRLGVTHAALEQANIRARQASPQAEASRRRRQRTA